MTTTRERLEVLGTYGVVSSTPSELSRCIEAIGSEPTELLARLGLEPARVRVADVAEAWALAHEFDVWHYIDFVDPSTVAPGQVYTTWVVVIPRAVGSIQVSYFRSRVREDGLGVDTIPPTEG